MVLGLMSVPASAALLKSYDFDGNLSDTLANGVDLVASGGTVSGGRYNFGKNEGLELTNALASTTDYAIEMKLRMDTMTGSWNKLIDFQGLASDLGLYILGTGVQFYNLTSNLGTVSLGTDFTIGFERAGTDISAYLDNVLLFTVSDAGSAAVSVLNVLNFFHDDFATGGNESFAGSVDYIRIHDDASTFSPVPVPAALPLLAVGLGALGFVGSRRKRKAVAIAA